MKRFLDFVKQALLGKGEGVSSLKRLTPEQIIKIGIDQGIGEKEAIAIFNAVKNGQADVATKELVTGLEDTKALMSTDDAVEMELREEYIEGKGADYFSFEEFKQAKEAETMNAARNIVATENPGPAFGTTAIEPTSNQSSALEYLDQTNYDELVKEGFYVEGSMKPGPAHHFNNPEKSVFNGIGTGPNDSATSRVVVNIARWKQDLIKNLEEGNITRAEYDQFYRNADDVFSTVYSTAKQVDIQKGFVEATATNPGASKVLTDYWPGENYAAKYITEEEIAGSGFKMNDTQIAESNFRNTENLNLMEQILEDTTKPGKLIEASQTDELQRYTALLDDARDSGNVVEENRIIKILNDAREQAVDQVPLEKIIFKDTNRTLNAMGGIIQGVKNRGK